MEWLTSDRPVPGHLRGGVVALGNFDGFHRGHQAVVGQARALAREAGRPLIVATFDPHPVRLFRPETPPFGLTTIAQRGRLIAGAGADAMLVFHFDRALADESADRFVQSRLIDHAGAAAVVVGYDFTYGKGRAGDTGTLARFGASHGLATHSVMPVMDAAAAVSSSRIRLALAEGDCATATALLTRPFTISGVVEHGAKLGRTLGYPTANLTLGDYIRPAYGIYAVRGLLDDGRVLDGAANLGIRPTIEGPPTELLEPYFFDFDGDLYGRTIEVQLIERLRPEAKFDGLEPLKAQMALDCQRARAILAATPPVA
ncbi:bifunctional riboflavin kinase/FAD synthetase [Sphingomonas solaris]|uniref:Riboflavin biosynthesis protein n=1 Tax=Alterirhizorhabdus solaris TaxID=2529389 RepID=A0A558R4S2_9SPHN|nr:bifunctional riboflavin kinase/FAD synthetase [Sphingomonas solaris]TVV74390.1 bifunctional riboflavin kinase/FAD synthetase [Sphingomonas solaris]